MPQRKHRRRKTYLGDLLLVAVLILAVGILFLTQCTRTEEEPPQTQPPTTTVEATTLPPTTLPEPETVEAFAQQNGLSLDAWPEYLLEFFKKSPESKEFVFQYPLKKDRTYQVDLSEYRDCQEVPLLMQWDERWGYQSYAGRVLGVSGCGPTCLSMACIYLLKEPAITPAYVASFAEENGYAISGGGSLWTLMSEGGKRLGLDIAELPLVDGLIIQNLEAGNLIICDMNPGVFTTSGHFILLTGCVDGKIRVNDSNSRERSGQLWELSQFRDQIRNLWVCKAP